MMPLAAVKPGDRWPQTLDLSFANGQRVTGEVAWIYPAPPQLERHWTDDARGLSIRAVMPADDSAALETNSIVGPYVLARVPVDAEGDLRLGEQVIQPLWCDVPNLESLRFDDLPRPRSDLPTLEMTPAHDRPDPVSPFEYWRWVMLADRLNMNPPPPWGGGIERLAAEHVAAMWRIGMGRLEAASPRIAAECRMLLTRTCVDRGHWFASWIADPVQVNSLFARLLDFSRQEADVLADAVAWLDAQPPLLAWPLSPANAQNQAEIAMVVLRDEPLTVKLSWQGSGQQPDLVQLEPGVLTRLNIDLPPAPESGPALGGVARAALAGGRPYVLALEAWGRTIEVVAGTSRIGAAPPGVFFRALAPPLTLADVQTGMQRTVGSEYATHVQMRRLDRRWELFCECRRPHRGGEQTDHAPDSDSSTNNAQEPIRTLDDLRGLEAITIFLGADDRIDQGPHPIQLVIPEQGYWSLMQGVNDGTLQIHRRSFADRWHCRIVLPDAWLTAGAAEAALVGFVRSHGDSVQLETGPLPSLPWRLAPGRTAIDLRYWDDLPRSQ